MGWSVYRTQRLLELDDLDVVVFDQLSSVNSGTDFREALEDSTNRYGWKMEYHDASDVTVQRLGRTPVSDILILRMHSGVFEDKLWVFSGEAYSVDRHVMEQVRGLLHMARCSSTSEVVFALGEEFISEKWGKLDDCLVILMGCEGLANYGLADVVVDKGAVGVVGWTRPVSLEESDEVTIALVELVMKGETLRGAVENVRGDRSFIFYPDEAGSFRIIEP